MSAVRKPTETPAYAVPDDIIVAHAAACGHHGRVSAMRLFCHADTPRQVFCMTNMAGGAAAAAAAVATGGYVSGTTVCTLVPVPQDFRCGRRAGGRMLVSSCDDCHTADDGAPIPT